MVEGVSTFSGERLDEPRPQPALVGVQDGAIARVAEAAPAGLHPDKPESVIADKHACLALIDDLPALSAEEHSLLTRHVIAVFDARAAAMARFAAGIRPHTRPPRTNVRAQAVLVFQAAASLFVLKTQDSPPARTAAWIVAFAAVLLSGLNALLAYQVRSIVHPRTQLTRWLQRMAGSDHYESALDCSMLALLVAAARARRAAAGSPATRTDRRRILDALDLAERRLTSRRVNVSPLSWTTYAAERELHWRVAGLVRAHADAAATAVGSADLNRVAESLTSGLVAWAQGDTGALLAVAPTATARQRWRPVLLRLGSTAALAVAAALLPRLIPGLESFGPYLWAAAAGTLIAGAPESSQAISKVADSLLPKSKV